MILMPGNNPGTRRDVGDKNRSILVAGAQGEGPRPHEEGTRLNGRDAALHHSHEELGVAGLDEEGGGEVSSSPHQGRVVIDQIRKR